MSKSPHAHLWRAWDNRLRRPVGLRVVDPGAPRFRQLHDGAVAAARITDRRFVNVLDVLGPEPDDELVIVTEWMPGISLTEALLEPMSAHAAAVITAQIAAAIASAHDQGVTHGHLRPAAVLLLPDGSVRLRGHGVDAGLYGVEPEIEPATADIRGIGCLLYACLTARWPSTEPTGMPQAAMTGGRPVPVRQCVADVPDRLATVIDDCWTDRYTSATAVARDLQEVADRLYHPAQPRRLTTRRQRVVAAGLVAAMVGGGLVMSLVNAANRPGSPVTAQPFAEGVADLVTTARPDEQRLPIVAVRDFDPFGVDGENPNEVRYAIDRDPLTAWTTVRYYDPAMGGKPGVGLRVDLGAPRPVTSVDLKLVGANSDLQVLTGTSPADDPARLKEFAEVTGAGSRILLRAPRPVTARYIVIWFTRLPWIDGGYRGGVRSVVVRSG